MKRIYSLLLIFLLMFSSVFPAVPSVAAATEDDTVYADGEYDLPFVVWQADKDDISVADGYLEKPAKVIIEDGEYTIQATLKNDSWWQYFKVESGGDFIDVDVLSEDQDADTSLVQFKVDDLDEVLNSKIHVIVEFINYDNKYDIRFNFDTSNIPLAEDTDLEEEPTDPEEEETEEPEQPEQPEEPEESDDPEDSAEDGDQPEEEPENPEEEPVDPEQPDEDSEETPGDAEEDTEQPET